MTPRYLYPFWEFYFLVLGFLLLQRGITSKDIICCFGVDYHPLDKHYVLWFKNVGNGPMKTEVLPPIRR